MEQMKAKELKKQKKLEMQSRRDWTESESGLSENERKPTMNRERKARE